MTNLALFCDGGSRGNPGPAASGFVVYKLSEKISSVEQILTLDITDIVIADGVYLGSTTNNQAEWKSVIFGLEKIKEDFGVEENVQVFMDSELVIKQIKGEYKVKHPEMKILHAKFLEVSKNFKKVEFKHILRAYNKQADSLVNQALDNDNK